MKERKVILYIAQSLDGFIARKNGDIGWLSIVDKKGEDYGYGEFIKNVDTVIMGRKTYEKVLTFGIGYPHSDKKSYILTRRKIKPEGKLNFYGGSLNRLIGKLKNEKGKNIFVDGGAETVNALLREKLIDEFVISIIPVMLGSGIRLFDGKGKQTGLKLTGCKNYPTGLVQLHYEKL